MLDELEQAEQDLAKDPTGHEAAKDTAQRALATAEALAQLQQADCASWFAGDHQQHGALLASRDAFLTEWANANPAQLERLFTQVAATGDALTKAAACDALKERITALGPKANPAEAFVLQRILRHAQTVRAAVMPENVRRAPETAASVATAARALALNAGRARYAMQQAQVTAKPDAAVVVL